ncbi:MAG TPA: bifunctional anthranilate synthase component I family protein/class IV aminotransferase [Thauera sp.]|uniref:bifunctional anthranilate synthase component I family protein/class IV aminotransferase n=1 Tax=Thauera sp. TaxID=1905334 RepID=UPI002BFBEE96|nr:bifunctional anthranilate synthase component I family protein/class IV aminotransferase [Thauera sp.]HRV79603.1 bifunctional anthranilate synthase component I family protein/class IV aminotransferase [Thauera sp.]
MPAPSAAPPIDSDSFALLDDCHATAAAPSSRLYGGLVRVHRCADPSTLEAMWAAVDADLRAGLHAVVLADYEWGVRLNGVVAEGPGPGAGPGAGGSLRVLMFATLARRSAAEVEAWLAEAEAREAESPAVAPAPAGAGEDARRAGPAPAGALGLRASVDRAAFEEAIARIHAAIAEGETYQVNYSYRLDLETFGSPLALYRRLRARQPVAFGALIRLPAEAGGPDWVLSCSPELFLRHHDGVLQARPMKGTAARSGDDAADALAARRLAADAKNRAENLMIVDLLRNDLGRVARTGSVRVPALFEVERYPTVLQMTSTVAAELPADVGFPALLRALFPCGSITGAPKHRTMQLITELETTPRGLYTGSLGWIDAPRPGQACGDFCLSVAIRTLTLERIEQGADALAGARHRGRMGVGAGIVIDSAAADEYAECRLKARFLSALDPGFALFETMYATREAGVRQLDRHLARLEASAAALDFVFERASVEAALGGQLAALPPATPSRLRLALHKDGRLELTAAALEALPPGAVTVLLAERPLDDPHGLGAYKTTLRARYDEGLRAALAAGAFDTLFFDSASRLTEGGRSNVFLLLDGEWRTPPAGRGVLPGTMRAALLEDPAWAAREAELRVEDLLRAQRIVLTNALRGAVEARLAGAGSRD